jgi:hypothetical protein
VRSGFHQTLNDRGSAKTGVAIKWTDYMELWSISVSLDRVVPTAIVVLDRVVSSPAEDWGGENALFELCCNTARGYWLPFIYDGGLHSFMFRNEYVARPFDMYMIFKNRRMSEMALKGMTGSCRVGFYERMCQHLSAGPSVNIKRYIEPETVVEDQDNVAIVEGQVAWDVKEMDQLLVSPLKFPGTRALFEEFGYDLDYWLGL